MLLWMFQRCFILIHSAFQYCDGCFHVFLDVYMLRWMFPCWFGCFHVVLDVSMLRWMFPCRACAAGRRSVPSVAPPRARRLSHGFHSQRYADANAMIFLCKQLKEPYKREVIFQTASAICCNVAFKTVSFNRKSATLSRALLALTIAPCLCLRLFCSG